jgi:hypothetical protein
MFNVILLAIALSLLSFYIVLTIASAKNKVDHQIDQPSADSSPNGPKGPENQHMSKQNLIYRKQLNGRCEQQFSDCTKYAAANEVVLQDCLTVRKVCHKKAALLMM